MIIKKTFLELSTDETKGVLDRAWLEGVEWEEMVNKIYVCKYGEPIDDIKGRLLLPRI